MILRPEDQLIISGLKLFPSEDDLVIIEKCISEIKDWNLVRNGVASLMYKNLTSGGIENKVPAEVLSRLKQTYFKITARNIFIIEKFRDIQKIFSDQELELIALKGIHLTDAIYKDIGLRPMSDIDILVHKDEAEKCRKILIEYGYIERGASKSDFIQKEKKHLLPLEKDGVTIEIHVQLHNAQFGYTINTDDFWKNSRFILLYGIRTRTLSPNDLLQHLCIHFDVHNSAHEVQLRMYGDIVNVIECYKNELNWKLFEESCKKGNCTKNVFRILLLVKKYFNADIPEAFIERNKFLFDEDTEDLFFKVLRADWGEILKNKKDYRAGSNLRSLRRVMGFRNKLAYLAGDVFPSRSFMCQNYKIKHRGLVYFYYPRRWLIGIHKLLVLSKNKLFTTKEK
jgi:hypothetical protein